MDYAVFVERGCTLWEKEDISVYSHSKTMLEMMDQICEKIASNVSRGTLRLTCKYNRRFIMKETGMKGDSPKQKCGANERYKLIQINRRA